MPSEADVVTTARAMIGTRWRHQGRVPQQGLDCAGLVVCTGKQLGMLKFDTVAYQRDSAANQFLAYFREHGREIPLARLRPGCIVALRESHFPCHCGVVGERDGRLTLIHAYAKRRRVVEELLTPEWYARIVGVFEYKGLG